MILCVPGFVADEQSEKGLRFWWPLPGLNKTLGRVQDTAGILDRLALTEGCRLNQLIH